jgi:hypothetical protein
MKKYSEFKITGSWIKEFPFIVLLFSTSMNYREVEVINNWIGDY